MRNATNIAMTVVLLLTVSGCRGGKVDVNTESDSFKDGQYNMTVRGLNAAPRFQGFLQGLQSPADKVKYINKSAEEGATKIYPLKSVYEFFSNDQNPEVAAAAKEALSKVPSPEDYEKLKKEELEAIKK